MNPSFSKRFCITLAISVALFLSSQAYPGQTGKIAGKVTDQETGQPLPGVNVIIEGTTLGAATDLEGDYVVLNVPPGTYSLKASMIGYAARRVTNVKVSVDLTTRIDFVLTPTVLMAEEVTVSAEAPLVQKDLTATLKIVRSEELQEMAVQEFNDVLQLQAGITTDEEGGLHMRGGRSSEIAYLIDGVSVIDPYDGTLSVEIENAAIEQLQVISGSFNAEYGQALSGVVDIVTKEGGEKYQARASLYGGDYISFRKDRLKNINVFDPDNIFNNLDDVNPTDIFNVDGSLSGPVPLTGNKITFHTTARYLDNDGWLYGTRVFNPSDSSFIPADISQATFQATGDRAKVPMNFFKKFSTQNKLSLRLRPNVKLGVGIFWDDVKRGVYGEIPDLKDRGRNESHYFRLNPDGNYKQKKDFLKVTPSITHTLSATTFYNLKLSYSELNFKQFVYEDPFDPRYVNPQLLLASGQNGFFTGGTGMWHEYRTSKIWLGKFDLTSQVHKAHQVKLGIELKRYEMFFEEFEIVPENPFGPFKPSINPITAFNHNRYRHNPTEFSAYIQDKIELTDMIVNIGVRFDYFDADGDIPTDLSDPNGSPKVKSQPHSQLSPRLGISYPITDRGAIHFSYGFFFQRPNFEFLYANPEFEIDPRVSGRVATIMGNANLKNEKTINYEIGLQQQFGDDVGFSLTTFYKDINNLIGTEILAAEEPYARYVNLDYGNVMGVTAALSVRSGRTLSAFLDYTFQTAKGNASDPNAQFADAASVPPTESEIQTVPLDWDQRHTVNLTVNITRPGSWGLGLIGKLGSGLPYTPTARATRGFRETFENSERKPMQLNFDLTGRKEFKLGAFSYSVFFKIFNVFDRRNEVKVYKDTGRAGYTLDIFSRGEARGMNTLEEFFLRPDFYSEPRRVQVGMSVSF
jgi:outer membrane receptor protein involved in Fe transport